MAEGKASARILIVDDEIGVREALGELFGEEGYGVLTAADAQSAHATVSDTPIDLVLLDFWMPPGDDGVQLLRRWRDEDMLRFPVVMISAHATLDAAVEAVRIGATDVLEKPVNSQQLLTTVRKRLATRKSSVHDSMLLSEPFGACEPLVRLKGRLLRAAHAAPAPVAIVGRADDSPEFFARMLQRRGLPWVSPASWSQIAEAADELLAQAAHGTLYVRYEDEQDEGCQRALCLLMRNAQARSVRVVIEFAEAPEILHAAGKLGADVLRKLADEPIAIPRLQDYRDDLPTVVGLAAKRMALGDGASDGQLSAAALKGLADEAQEWSTDGLSRLLGVLRTAFDKAGEGARFGAGSIRKLAAGDSSAAQLMHEDVFNRPWREARDIFERQYYSVLMQRSKNNYAEAARLSGLERTYLYRKVRLAMGSEEQEAAAAAEPDQKAAGGQ